MNLLQQSTEQLIPRSMEILSVCTGVGACILAFFDAHAAGIGAMAAVGTLVVSGLITIYFKRKELKLMENR